MNLGRNLNMNSKDLDQESVKVFGVKMAYLTIKDASALIDTLKSKAAKSVNFGLLYGQGARGLARYAKTGYGVSIRKRG